MDQKEEPMKMNFECFQIHKWILQTVRAKKNRWINGVICLVSMFPSWVMVFIQKSTFFAILWWPQQGIAYYTIMLSLIALEISGFDILTANISWTVAQTFIKRIIFWKSVMRPLRCIYVGCLNRVRFLAEVNTKLQIDNLRNITGEGNIETRQMTMHFLI